MAYIGNVSNDKGERYVNASPYEVEMFEGQTEVVIPGGYVAGFLIVRLNGVVLAESDYVATDDVKVVLNVPATDGDVFSSLALSRFDVADAFTKTESDARFRPIMFSVMWWPNRATVPGGYVAADGQELSRITFPEAAGGIDSGIVPVTDDATWIADPTKRGSYSSGDGSTTFRLPDYNGKSVGSLGSVYLTGDGLKSAGVNGDIREDQMQGHIHNSGVSTDSNAAIYGSTDEDVPGESTQRDSQLSGSSTTQPVTSEPKNDGTNGEPRTADHTHGTDVSGCWCISLFGKAVNVGSADAEQLASDYANLSGAFQTLDSQLDFTIIYPNGGTEASPATITTDTRYVESNPFPGHSVIALVEVFIDDVWGQTGFIYSSASTNGYGVLATHLDDGDIVVRTANGGLITVPRNQGHAFPTSTAATSAPARVKVWKVKGSTS